MIQPTAVLGRHPLSELWGDMSEKEKEDFAEYAATDVDEDSLLIYTLDGMILDGWQRYQEFRELGIEPRFVAYAGDDPVAFVIRRNANRRHMNAGQRSLAIRDALNWSAREETSESQSSPRVSAVPNDNSFNDIPSEGSHSVQVDAPPENSRVSHERMSAADIARQANASQRTVQQAIKADEAGLGGYVRNGALSAKAAADIARHEDISEELRTGSVTPDDALAEVKARKPLTKAERLEAALAMTEMDLEKHKEYIDLLNAENAYLRKLTGRDGGLEAAADSFREQQGMIETLRSTVNLWMDRHNRILNSRNYWREHARRLGHVPFARDKENLEAIEKAERESTEELARKQGAFDQIDALIPPKDDGRRIGQRVPRQFDGPPSGASANGSEARPCAAVRNGSVVGGRSEDSSTHPYRESGGAPPMLTEPVSVKTDASAGARGSGSRSSVATDDANPEEGRANFEDRFDEFGPPPDYCPLFDEVNAEGDSELDEFDLEADAYSADSELDDTWMYDLDLSDPLVMENVMSSRTRYSPNAETSGNEERVRGPDAEVSATPDAVATYGSVVDISNAISVTGETSVEAGESVADPGSEMDGPARQMNFGDDSNGEPTFSVGHRGHERPTGWKHLGYESPMTNPIRGSSQALADSEGGEGT